MVPEILFLLSGHPSVLVSPSPSASDATGYVIAPAYTEGHFHPGEVGSLTTLALLGFRYRKVDSWIARAQAQARKEILRSSAPHRSTERTSTADDGHGQVEDWQYLTGMCTRLRSVLDEYQELILFTEQRMLAEDDGFCGEDAGFIPLSTLLATYAAWQTKMAALENLVDTLQRGPSGPVPVQPSSKPSSSTPPVPLWPPGPLITLLHTLHFESETSLAKTYLQLSHAVQLPFLSQLLVFLLYGQPCSLAYDAGADPLATHRRTYALREGAIPDVIGGQVRESMLWVGRAVAVVRKEGRELPPDVKTRLEGEVRSVWVEDEANFKAVVEQVRAEVGDWLWRNILTMKDVKRTIDALSVPLVRLPLERANALIIPLFSFLFPAAAATSFSDETASWLSRLCARWRSSRSLSSRGPTHRPRQPSSANKTSTSPSSARPSAQHQRPTRRSKKCTLCSRRVLSDRSCPRSLPRPSKRRPRPLPPRPIPRRPRSRCSLRTCSARRSS